MSNGQKLVFRSGVAGAAAGSFFKVVPIRTLTLDGLGVGL